MPKVLFAKVNVAQVEAAKEREEVEVSAAVPSLLRPLVSLPERRRRCRRPAAPSPPYLRSSPRPPRDRPRDRLCAASNSHIYYFGRSL